MPETSSSPSPEVLARRKAERELRSAERKYRGFFENAVEGVYQSTRTGRYLSVNPALARLYGYGSPAETLQAVGNIARDIYVDPKMRERFKTLIERDGEVRNLEYEVRRRDGTTVWISETARVARNRQGRVLYYEGIIHDLTDRRKAAAEAAQMEQHLRQAQKLEAIGTLASGVAHDFNNILGAIIGFTELALYSAQDNPAQREHLGEVMAASARAKDLVQRILAFGRPAVTERRIVELGPVVAEAAKLLRATIPAAISIDYIDMSDGAKIVADPGQIHQVVVNLGANAGHAMRGQAGLLRIKLDRVDSRLDPWIPPALPAGFYLRLEMSDTGHGMPPEIIDRIFEPFFTTKPVGEGTGLGLSMVHGIVKSCGGEIQVRSVPRGGTTFRIYLPRAKETAPAGGGPPR